LNYKVDGYGYYLGGRYINCKFMFLDLATSSNILMTSISPALFEMMKTMSK